MASSYTKKDVVALQFEDNKAHIRHTVRRLSVRVENELLAQMNEQYQAALARGEVLTLTYSPEEVEQLVRETTASLLGDGNAEG